MSDFKFNCPHCQQPFEAPGEMLGQEINCPTCNGAITLPPQQPKLATFVPPPPASVETIPPVPPSTSSLLHTAIQWYKAQSLSIRVIIAAIGWPVTLVALPFRIQSKWLRCCTLFVVIEGLLIAFLIAMRSDLARSASSAAEMWGQLFLMRVFVLGALPAWLVHRSLKNLRRKIDLTTGKFPSALPTIVFFLPGIGLTIYSNWRYELWQRMKQSVPNKASEAIGAEAAPQP
jgi:hypothetical protein